MFSGVFLEKPVFHFRLSEASFIIFTCCNRRHVSCCNKRKAPWRRSWTPSSCQGLSSTAPVHKIKPQGIRPMVATVATVGVVPTKWWQGVPFRPPLPRAGGQDDVSSQAHSLKSFARRSDIENCRKIQHLPIVRCCKLCRQGGCQLLAQGKCELQQT